MNNSNSKHKDRLFCYLFGSDENKSWTLSLFNAVNGTDYQNPSDVQIETIDNVIYLSMRNDVAFIVDDTLNLYEHQSTYNPNMPLRQLMYLTRLYEKYIELNKYDIYSANRITLPVPKLVVFYNGKRDSEDEVILRLSDLFSPESSVQSDVEVRVRMLNINYGHNRELMKKCKVLSEYAWFVDRVRIIHDETGNLEIAIDQTIDEMSKDALIRPFLIGHKAEVLRMSILTEYNEELHLKNVRAEGLAEGSAETKKAVFNKINQSVESGTITREQADILINLIQED